MKDEIWQKKEYLLFDLDGTLTDPKQGITTCVQYALKDFGIEEPDLDKLEPFIGPPLKDSFMEFYGFTEKQAQRAVTKYRERFQDIGIFENEVYRGIPQMLKKLRLRGMRLAVASSKPTVFVERILEHFHIREYFDVVVGSELDGRRVEKEEVVREALRRLFPDGRVDKSKVYMIGDRKFDVEGAKALGIDSVGVSYGYGGMEELRAAHADYIVRSVEELRRFLLRGYEDMEKDLNSLQKIWLLLFSFVLFLAVRGFAENLCLVSAGRAGMEITRNLSTIVSVIGFLAGGLAIFGSARKCVRRTIRDMYLTHLTPQPGTSYGLAALSAAGLSLGGAMLLGLTGITGSSDAYQAVAEVQSGASFGVALVCYGLVSPLAEELLFRGVIYGYLRRFYDVMTAIVASSILFGVYHGNMVQALYAAAMGYLIAYAYEYFADFRVPVCMHVGMNLLSLIVSYTGLGGTRFCSWPVCIVLLLLGGGSTVFLARRKRIL